MFFSFPSWESGQVSETRLDGNQAQEHESQEAGTKKQKNPERALQSFRLRGQIKVQQKNNWKQSAILTFCAFLPASESI